MSTMSLPPSTRMRGSSGRGGGRYGGGGAASYHNAALGSIPGGYRPPNNAAAARPPMMPANNSNRPPLMPAPPMMYYGAGPPLLHQMPGSTFPRGALQTGAGAAAQSHIPAGSMMPTAQVQQNNALSTQQQIYQMQLAGAAAQHYSLPHPASLFPAGPSTQYNIKPPHQHVYTPQAAHQPQQQHSQSQPKRRTAAIKIINPDTNSEIDMSSAQSTSSGVSSASSSTTRLSDNAETQVPSSDTENPVAKEFREKVHGSMKPAPNAIIKSPTETKAPASAIDQSLDSEPAANTTGQVAAKDPAPSQHEIQTSQSSAFSKPTVVTDKLTETVQSQAAVAEHEPTPGEVRVSEPDRSTEQPSAALPPKVTQSTKGDSTVGAASTDSIDFDRQPQSVSPVTSQVAVDSKAAPQAPSPSPDSSLTVEIVDPEPVSLQTQSPDSLTQMNSPESHASSAQDHSPKPTIQEHPQELSSGLLPTPSPSSDLEKLAAAVQEPLPIPEHVDKDNETAGSVEQEPSLDTTDEVAIVDKELKQKEREEEPPPKALSDRSRGSDRKVTRKQEPQFKPDTTHQIEVDSEPEVEALEEPFVNGDSEDSRKYYTYDRDQLLSFRKCNQAPEDLLKAECFKSQKDSLQQPFGNIPRQKRINQGPHRKIIAHQPNREEKVELRKAENKWIRHSATDKDTSDDDKETTEIFRKFQGILNKLTPQKFKDLAEQALKLPLCTVERLKGCIDKIFTKALQEPSFSVAYANLCRVMSPIKVSWVTEDGKDQATSFRRELLTKCQKEFEKDKKDDEEREEMQKAVEDAETPELKQERQASLEAWEAVARRRSLGNIRFIGELFKLKMLSESIMHDCIVRLLRSSSDEESIECFCKLIVTTGKDLDHPKGKQLMDKYFTRIYEIISKKKISARMKFMLQDVQETRRNEWVARRQESLKTIDQIHREAKQEQQEEQEMIKLMNIHTHPSLAKPGRGDSGDKRRGGKSSGNSGQDEWRGKDASSRRQEPLKVDVNRLPSILRKGGGTKDTREATALAPGSSLRPSGWGRSKPVSATPPPEQSKSDKPGSSKGPLRSSSGGSKRSSGVMGRGSQQGPKRAVSGGVPRSGSPIGGAPFNSRSEKESALSLVKQLSHPHQDQDQTHQEPEQQKPVRDKYDEETISRQSGTIVDELANNRDLKEALACVEEMESPNLMNVLVRECICHALEKLAITRTATGELFHHLLTNKILSQDQVSEGLFEVLEISDDLAVDIPLFWNYFAVCVCEMVKKQSYSLNILAKTVTKACDKAPKCIAKVLACCAEQSSPDDTCKLWSQSGVTWATLGLNDSSAVEDLLESEGIMFLRSSPAAKQSFSIDDHPHLPDLVKILRTNKSDDSTMNWIKERFSEEECKTPQFVNTLTQAIITVSTCGETDLSVDEFRQLSLLLKKHVDENESLQIEILNAAQVTVSQLGHPVGLLGLLFNNLYDVEVVKESAFVEWKEQDSDLPGRGVALQSVKGFYEWLDQADPESDEGGT